MSDDMPTGKAPIPAATDTRTLTDLEIINALDARATEYADAAERARDNGHPDAATFLDGQADAFMKACDIVTETRYR